MKKLLQNSQPRKCSTRVANESRLFWRTYWLLFLSRCFTSSYIMSCRGLATPHCTCVILRNHTTKEPVPPKQLKDPSVHPFHHLYSPFPLVTLVTQFNSCGYLLQIHFLQLFIPDLWGRPSYNCLSLPYFTQQNHFVMRHSFINGHLDLILCLSFCDQHCYDTKVQTYFQLLIFIYFGKMSKRGIAMGAVFK